jgi:hypothetical protein
VTGDTCVTIADDDVIVEYVKKGHTFAIPKWALNLPEWVPSYLADFARMTWARELVDPVKGPILKRLLTHPWMQTFYEPLTATRNRDGRHRLPAQFPTTEQQPDPSKRQDFAIGHIVWLALCYAVNKPQVTFQHEVATERNERQEIARKVQELADELHYDEKYSAMESPRSDAFDARGSKVLDAAADIIERMAAGTGVGCIIATNKSDDLEAQAHGFAVSIATDFELMFGKACYKETATVTSVALGLGVKIPWTRIRDWRKAHEKHRNPNELANIAAVLYGDLPSKEE